MYRYNVGTKIHSRLKMATAVIHNMGTIAIGQNQLSNIESVLYRHHFAGSDG